MSRECLILEYIHASFTDKFFPLQLQQGLAPQHLEHKHLQAVVFLELVQPTQQEDCLVSNLPTHLVNSSHQEDLVSSFKSFVPESFVINRDFGRFTLNIFFHMIKRGRF